MLLLIRRLVLAGLCAAALGLTGCQTYTSQTAERDAAVRNGNFAFAAAQADKDAEKNKDGKDGIVYRLEQGAILRSAALEWLLGVTADRVIRYASCPVLVAPNLGPMTSLRGRPWVVAVDFEAPSREALTLAISLARGCDAKVFGVHVLPSLPPLAADAHEGEPDGAAWDPTVEEQDAQAQLRAFVAAACAEVPGAPPVDVRVTRGDPADDVVTVAESLGAALLVIGTHGRKGLSHALLGSVAERVLRRAKVPVLSVRPRPA
jgi:nucleotide-binding universal stress UspA family protein